MIKIITLSLDDIYTLAGGGEVSCTDRISGHEIKLMSEGRYELIYRKDGITPYKITESMA